MCIYVYTHIYIVCVCTLINQLCINVYTKLLLCSVSVILYVASLHTHLISSCRLHMLTTYLGLNLCLWQFTVGRMLLVDPLLDASTYENQDFTYHNHF